MAAPEVIFLTCDMYRETYAAKVRSNSTLGQKINAFLVAKRDAPLQPFGSSDKPYQGKGIFNSVVPGLRHAHLTHDISIVYTISGTKPKVIKLYGLFGHDESGTGTPPNPKKQKSLAVRMGNQSFS